MKTPEQIFKKLGNRGEYAALPSITVEEIAAIQSDAREGMVSKEELHAAGPLPAMKREYLRSIERCLARIEALQRAKEQQ